MKTTRYLVSVCIAITSLAGFSSCDKENDGDTTPPIIELIDPKEGSVLTFDGEHGIHFEMKLSDNDMLASYKVEIHSNFNNHSHDLRTVATEAFFYNKTWDVSGLRNTSIHHHEIVVPLSTTPGKYHLLVHCTDVSGNQSNIARNIELVPVGGAIEHEE